MNAKSRRQIQTKPASPTPGVAKTRVLLVDDHPLVREGLAVTINQEPDMTVCAHAASVSDALEAAATAHPDLAVVDLTLDGSHGIDLLKDLRLQYPAVRVLVLSMHDEMLYAERAARTGARGYLMKKAPPERLVEAIRTVARGGLSFSEAILLRMHREMSTGQRAPGTSPMTRLSDREIEVFELLGRGMKTRQIADELHISMKTVQAHCEHIKEKLEVPDFTSLTRCAVHWLATEQGGGRPGLSAPVKPSQLPAGAPGTTTAPQRPAAS